MICFKCRLLLYKIQHEEKDLPSRAQGNQHIPPKRHFWKMFILLKDVFHGWYVTLSAILSSTPSELTVYQAGLAGNHTAFDSKRRWWWVGSLADHCTMWIQMNQQGMRLDSWILIWEVEEATALVQFRAFTKWSRQFASKWFFRCIFGGCTTATTSTIN